MLDALRNIFQVPLTLKLRVGFQLSPGDGREEFSIANDTTTLIVEFICNIKQYIYIVREFLNRLYIIHTFSIIYILKM